MDNVSEVVVVCLFHYILSDPMPRNCKLFFDWQEDAHIQQGGLGDLITVLVSLSLSTFLLSVVALLSSNIIIIYPNSQPQCQSSV